MIILLSILLLAQILSQIPLQKATEIYNNRLKQQRKTTHRDILLHMPLIDELKINYLSNILRFLTNKICSLIIKKFKIHLLLIYLFSHTSLKLVFYAYKI